MAPQVGVEGWHRELSCSVTVCMQAILLAGGRASLVVQLKLLMWPALILYYLELYSNVNMVAKHWGLDYSLAVILLAARCVQSVTVTVALVSETTKCAPRPFLIYLACFTLLHISMMQPMTAVSALTNISFRYFPC